MPVIPDCVPKFVIRPPCTTNDDGLPTVSLSNDIKRVFLLIEDERHLVASTLLNNIKQRITTFETKHGIVLLHSNSPTKTTTTAATQTQPKGTVPNNNNAQKNNVLTTLHHHNKHSNKKGTSFAESHHLIPKNYKSMTKQEKHQYDEELKEYVHVAKYIQQKEAVLKKLARRTKLFRKAQQNLNENDDWIYASTHFGITTYYRHESDSSLSVKLDGEMDGVPLFEQLCVLKEVDLHYKWSPFCTSSLSIADLDKLDLVGWFMIGLSSFGLCRDGCFRAVGCDNISEDGSIILAGRGIKDKVPTLPPPTSIQSDQAVPEQQKQQQKQFVVNDDEYNSFLYDDPILDKLDIPPVPTRRGSGRMTIRRFEGVIHIIDPTRARTKIVANIDPNISFLPTVLLEFIMKHLAGVVLAKLQYAAKKAVRNPVHNEHARLMRTTERVFYHDWLLPKFEAVCRKNNWSVPPVAAFSLTKAQLLEEQRYYDKKGNSNTIDVRHTAGTGEMSSFDNHSVDDVLTNMSVIAEINDNNNQNHGDMVSEIMGMSNDDDDNGTYGSGSTRQKKKKRNTMNRNRIMKFLQEQEEKVKRRKEEEIALGRRRSAEFLKPKQLSMEQEKRLHELKVAKHKRFGLPPVDEENTITATTTTRSVIVVPMDGVNTSSNSGTMMIGDTTNNKDETGSMYTTMTTTTSTTTNVGTTHSLIVQWYTKQLYQTSTKMRFVYIGILIAMLFVALHADVWVVLVVSLLSASSSFFTPSSMPTTMLLNNNTSSNSAASIISKSLHTIIIMTLMTTSSTSRTLPTLLLQDLIVIMYMLCVCCTIHFLLCNSILVFLFDCFEVTSKTGIHMKDYYTTQVHYGTSILSIGIVLFSIGKGLCVACIRILLLCLIQLSLYVFQQVLLLYDFVVVYNGNNDTTNIVLFGSTFTFLDVMVQIVTKQIRIWMYTIQKTIYTILQRWLLTSNPNSSSSNNTPTTLSLSVFLTEYNTWRYDAFVTCRWLLTYTAVFLLILVGLLTISARYSNALFKGYFIKNNNNKEEKEEDGSLTPNMIKKNAVSRTVSSLSADESIDFDGDMNVTIPTESADTNASNSNPALKAGRQRRPSFFHNQQRTEEEEQSLRQLLDEKAIAPSTSKVEVSSPIPELEHEDNTTTTSTKPQQRSLRRRWKRSTS